MTADEGAAHGEDIAAWHALTGFRLPERDRVAVDIGAGDPVRSSNTWLFEQRGWRRVLVDRKPAPGVHVANVTDRNVCSILGEHEVPAHFGLLSIDIDGMDYWVLRSVVEAYKPRVIVLEYNCALPYGSRLSLKSDEYHSWHGDAHFGASAWAFIDMLARHRYVLAETFSIVNLMFVHDGPSPVDLPDLPQQLDYMRGKPLDLDRFVEVG